MSYFKHESAYVDEPCAIGDGTKIWHFCYVQSGARIGERCVLGQNVNVANDVVIGSNVKVQNNVSIYTGTVIDDVFLGPSCVLTNVTNPRSQVNRHSLYEKTLLRRGAALAPMPRSFAVSRSVAMPSWPPGPSWPGMCQTMHWWSAFPPGSKDG